MNKKELIESIAGAADISKAAAEKALNGTLAAVAESLKKVTRLPLLASVHSPFQSVMLVRVEIRRQGKPLRFQKRKL